MDVLTLTLLTTQSNACLDFNRPQGVIYKTKGLYVNRMKVGVFSSLKVMQIIPAVILSVSFTKSKFAVFCLENCNTGNHA